MLAGVSTDYYARLERGNLSGVSESVLDAIARALRLDEAETAYLQDLTRAANTTPKPARRRPSPPQRIRPSVQRILDGMADVPAIVMNGRLDLLATSTLGAALYSPATLTGTAREPGPLPASSTRRPERSTRTGTRRRTPPWPCCAPRPADAPMTATYPI